MAYFTLSVAKTNSLQQLAKFISTLYALPDTQRTVEWLMLQKNKHIHLVTVTTHCCSKLHIALLMSTQPSILHMTSIDS